MTDTPMLLVLEDQFLIAYETATLLKRHGFRVLGPFGNVEDALAAISSTPPDAALLDINMGDGVTSHAVADALLERNLPFVFLTGYGSADVAPVRFKEIRKITKPTATDELISIVKAMTDKLTHAPPDRE